MVMILVLSLAMNMAVLATVGYSYSHNKHRPAVTSSTPHEMRHHFYDVLELTPVQMTKMTPMADSFHDRLKNLHSTMNGKKDAMLQFLASQNIERARIEGLRNEMNAIQGRIQKTVIAHLLDVKAILDPDQQKRFFNLLRKNMHMEPGMFIGPKE
jgi:Spy/CpxP family protein refolding chaperone